MLLMKVLCVDNKYLSQSITVGKWYEVELTGETSDEYTYLITNDNGQKNRIDKDKFLTIEQYRDKILTELGI